MKAITSESNANFRAWLKLANTPRAVREAGQTLAEGWHLPQAALDSGIVPQAVLIRRGATVSTSGKVLLDRLEIQRVPSYELAASLYDRIAPVKCGAGLMVVLPISFAPLPHVLNGDALYLDGIQDPGNAGALLRVAAAAGLIHVFAAPTTTALWAPKVLRGGQGAHFALRINEQVPADQLRGLGAVWIAASAHDAVPLWSAPLPTGPIGWVFGSEGQGLSPEAENLCSSRVTVPISCKVESLNVASAAAVCLFERCRRLETNGRS